MDRWAGEALYWRDERVTAVEIPNRSLFRQPEVCEIAQVQPYVLRSWEAEFPDLGVSKTEGAARVYRRADLERVLHIKHLLFVEGLTLAGARRRLAEQAPAAAEAESLDALLGSDARERILRVKQGLRELAKMLARAPGNGHAESLFDLAEREPPSRFCIVTRAAADSEGRWRPSSQRNS